MAMARPVPAPKPSVSTIDEAELEILRELRVMLPTDVHRKLRSLKLLRGMNISHCVADALEAYFEERGAVEPPVQVVPRPAKKSG